MLERWCMTARDCKSSKDAGKLPGWGIFLILLVIIFASGLLGFVAVLVRAHVVESSIPTVYHQYTNSIPDCIPDGILSNNSLPIGLVVVFASGLLGCVAVP